MQVPSREAELTFGWPFHHWLIDRIDDTLVFEGRGGARALTVELMHAGFAEARRLSSGSKRTARAGIIQSNGKES